MISTHFSFLLTDRMRRITIVIFLFMSVFLYTLADLNHSASTLIIYRQNLELEYVLQAHLIVKFVVVLSTSLWWIYATKLNQYDVYLIVRHKPQYVVYTKAFVIFLITIIYTLVFTMIMVFIWMMFPGELDEKTVFNLLFEMSLFTLFYNVLFWLFHTIFKHVFALFIPVFGYLITTIGSDGYSGLPEENSTIHWTQILFPDVMYSNSGFYYTYGNVFVVTTLLVCILIIMRIYRNFDFI